MYRVPFVQPGKHYLSFKHEIDEIMQDTLTRGDLICRSQLKQFEQNLAAFAGTRFAVGLNSGFHALHLSLIAAGVGNGDEVILPAHTFVACISAVVHAGATPVLVDVEDDYNIDPSAVERAITARTKAIMPVHLNGLMCNMHSLMQIARSNGLIVIEDAAQALGASLGQKKAGSFGLAGCFSFYPFKILGAFGDAGAVTTDDEELALKITHLRFNGEDRTTGEYRCHGFSCALDNLQAALLDRRLRHVPLWLERRRRVAAMYDAGLNGVGDLILPTVATAERQIYQNYVVRSAKRDELVAYLKLNGVEPLVHWPKPVWLHKGLQLENYALPKTEQICREVLSLPMNAEVSDEDVDFVIETICRFFSTL